jgi:hypothetical protein
LLTAFLGQPLWAVPALPLAWRFAEQIAIFVGARTLPPRRLLRLDMEKGCPTSPDAGVRAGAFVRQSRARALADGLEALGALGGDDNVEYLLLCDFRDAPEREMGDDQALAALMRGRVAAMNARRGRDAQPKYHYLQRERRYARADALWRGHERKRGAVKALNRLLMTGDDGEFAPERPAPNTSMSEASLRGDAGRRYPRAAKRPRPADRRIAHPLNHPRVEDGARKGYAQSRPGWSRAAPASRFARLMGGGGLTAIRCRPPA